MEQFKQTIKTDLAVDWNTRVGSKWNHTLEAHTKILTFMHKLNALDGAKRIHWYTPGEIKHLCEYWLRSQDDYNYVCRDLCTSFAIALGMPVDLNKNNLRTKIGLPISNKKWANLWYNIANNGAVNNFEMAMLTSPEKYQFKKYQLDND